MAQLDRASPDKDSPLEPLKAAKAAVKFVENPQRGLAKAIVRAVLEKSASFNTLGVFKNLNEKFGHEWWDWEPETIWAMAPELTGGLRDVVMALQCTVNTNSPFEHWHIFEKVGLAFNNHHVDFGVVQPLEPNEASLTIYILKMIRPKEEFDPEVLGYIAAVCHSAGIVYTPPELFGPVGAQGHLTKIAPDESGVGHDTAMCWPDGEPTSAAVKIQIAKLREIKDYVKSRL